MIYPSSSVTNCPSKNLVIGLWPIAINAPLQTISSISPFLGSSSKAPVNPFSLDNHFLIVRNVRISIFGLFVFEDWIIQQHHYQ